MNETGTTTAPDSARDVRNSGLPSSHHRTPTAPNDLRLMELEIENSRLQRLVAELLLKNQQLRKEQE